MFPANSWNLAWGGVAIRTLHAEPKADIELRIGDEPRWRPDCDMSLTLQDQYQIDHWKHEIIGNIRW
jgi:hypothetical protein